MPAIMYASSCNWCVGCLLSTNRIQVVDSNCFSWAWLHVCGIPLHSSFIKVSCCGVRWLACNWVDAKNLDSIWFSLLQILFGVLYCVTWVLQATAVEGTIQQLFEGHHMNYIECINVDYKSTRKESFYGNWVHHHFTQVLHSPPWLPT
jgi:hypothetical protein